MLVAAALVALVGVVVLLVLTAVWVPPQPVLRVAEDDLGRDFTDDERARERAFRRRVRPWGLASVALDVLIPTVLVLSGGVAAVAHRTPGPWFCGAVAAFLLLVVVSRLATLPGAIVVRRVCLEVGLAAGSWRRWVRDLLVGLGLGVLLGGLGLLGWIGAARLWPDVWWLPVGIAAAVVVVIGSFLVPVLVEPLFLRFSPLADGALRDELLALAERDHVRVRDVLVADASRRTTALNAYVSGLGRTRRIVVHDTLLDRGADDEVRAVVAHELGHVVAHDVRTGTVLGAVGALVTVAASAVVLAAPGVLALGGSDPVGDPATVGLLVAGGAWLGLLSAPVQNAVSRRLERRADAHALALADDPVTIARMQRTLAVSNIAPLKPPRILHVWFGTHPTSPERIAAARRFAEQRGEDVPDLVG
ncbi:MAG TPA: M48 family metalloprotease [Candidatus Nanopelagicales bacterium]|nr:M48 family metalloprotease [Candidatus Nanopelagicales bacterium]